MPVILKTPEVVNFLRQFKKRRHHRCGAPYLILTLENRGIAIFIKKTCNAYSLRTQKTANFLRQ